MISSIFNIVGLILLCLGLIVFMFGTLGIYKYTFVLNRMHSAGMGDTLGLFLCMLGLIFISGINYTSAKFFLIVCFMWFTSPTASHMLSQLEALTDDEVSKNAEVRVSDLKSYVDGYVEEEK